MRNQTYFITFRTEYGLPFPTTLLTRRILEGIFCKAFALYGCEVVAFTFMSNHAHLIVTVTNPEVLDDFIGYVKRESAHAVNRLLGRRKRTVWAAGYDSPIVLDFDTLIEKLAYVYSNPAEANIADSIDDYAGFSSWKMFLSGGCKLEQKRLCRTLLPYIGTGSVSIDTQQKLINELDRNALESNAFVLSPYAFTKSFQVEHTEAEIKEMIVSRVRAREEEFRKLRRKPVINKLRLLTGGIVLRYSSRKFGRRMICHSANRELRAQYISWFKRLCEDAAYIYQQYRNRLTSLLMPPGLFCPGGILSANVWIPPN